MSTNTVGSAIIVWKDWKAPCSLVLMLLLIGMERRVYYCYNVNNVIIDIIDILGKNHHIWFLLFLKSTYKL